MSAPAIREAGQFGVEVTRMQITWKYVKPLKANSLFDQLSGDIVVKLPDMLMACLKKNNGGRPSSKSFDTTMAKGYVFSSLYSFNDDDVNSVSDMLDDLISVHLFPVGIESGGNSICYHLGKGKMVLLNHETGKTEDVLLGSNEMLFSSLL